MKDTPMDDLLVDFLTETREGLQKLDEALLQLERQLQPGEQVLARAEVVQRHWWDHFRTTPGVLAATDRRLVHVATVPPALFHVDDDPPSYDEWTVAELRERAAELDVEGRSTMTKDELVDALRDH